MRETRKREGQCVMNQSACDECRTIAEEFRRALVKVQASPKLKVELRAAGEAFLEMMGGTEEGFERAERVLGRFQMGSRRPGLLGTDDPIRKMYEHHARTGHMALRVLFGK